MNSSKPHAIVFPYPYQGHITPMINLVVKLASNGFTITYVHTEFIHHTISKARGDDVDVFSEARKSGLDIRYTTLSDGFPFEFDRDFNFEEFWETMFRDFPIRVDELIRRTIKSSSQSSAHGAPIFFLIADTCYTWPATIAKKHNLIHVSFWTEPALVFSINYHLDLLRLNGHLPDSGNVNYPINYIPGCGAINRKDLMSHIQDPDNTTPALLKIFDKAFEQVKNADFILCNTVHELEQEVLSALNQRQSIYAIGPINFFTKNVAIWPESDCKQWLDSKPHGSVLYVSFGSIAQITRNEIEEIAEGLRLSQVYFIWVLRPDIAMPNESCILPVGFEDDVKERGLIVPWCDQIMVLSHPATGGFLTHCGWNSVLESMWCGVPMMCYPFFVDQPTNRKLVVDDWKIGINALCDGDKITKEEVANKVNILTKGQKSIDLRRESQSVRNTLQNALGKDGSSQRNFDHFVQNLKVRLYSKSDIGPVNRS